jgi:hypothetical protein
MNNVLRGFLKEAVSAKSLLKPKNLMRAAMLGMVAVPTGLAAKAGYNRGRSGEEDPRYLAASYDPISRRAQASRAAHINYNVLTKKPTEKQKRAPSKNYKKELIA